MLTIIYIYCVNYLVAVSYIQTIIHKKNIIEYVDKMNKFMEKFTFFNLKGE